MMPARSLILQSIEDDGPGTGAEIAAMPSGAGR